jgi:hypothetical protein
MGRCAIGPRAASDVSPRKDAHLDIREIGDRLEVMELLARCARGVDTQDWALWRDAFTEDAHVDHRSAGGVEGDRETVAQWREASLAPFPMTQHCITSVEIELAGDPARVRGMFYNPMRIPGAAAAHARARRHARRQHRSAARRHRRTRTCGDRGSAATTHEGRSQ